ncbi:MBL fold metallo-hydrolase [Mucilaginibacter gossypii]|uniref:MBL fold metallo-hydrolase n=1 Tax=Mucilaginibacter gossypii TaxID=551996 RepID=UPI000DCDE8B7|nr:MULTISPECIES: MBL fold metallo-hydrolase [Mucilaginibacter]QTE36337.1 MBL fold metallo-hydrolase [Mucilaginibacter gossypii]RAV60075.1 MBL fold metallo-hydrolase [Mucilaginibacter rubeus]
MKIEQFEDKGLSHYSYAILSECEKKIVLIDPSRDITSYLSYAKAHDATIIGIIETHPHADFVSGHLELQQVTGAVIYCSKLLGAEYAHQTFDDGNEISFGKIKLKALNTPGHSPDSISIVLEHNGQDKAVFTGDTLFIGDCGRPDLREQAGNLTAKREELAKQMYHSLRDKLLLLDDAVWVYPAHGAGTLCGKALSEANRSIIGAEKAGNWSLKEISETEFVQALLADQPFIPKYFAYDVALNKHGAMALNTVLADVPTEKPVKLNSKLFIIDARPEVQFKKGHLPGSINIQDGGKFETWLGSIIAPEEAFYLVAENEEKLKQLISKTAKIGYEAFIEAAFVVETGNEKMAALNINQFNNATDDFTIVDIRNIAEIKAKPIFQNAIHIPLYELRERLGELPYNKPIVVHCAGGYRSAAGSSIVANAFGSKTQIYDMGDNIKQFIPA